MSDLSHLSIQDLVTGQSVKHRVSNHGMSRYTNAKGGASTLVNALFNQPKLRASKSDGLDTAIPYELIEDRPLPIMGHAMIDTIVEPALFADTYGLPADIDEKVDVGVPQIGGRYYNFLRGNSIQRGGYSVKAGVKLSERTADLAEDVYRISMGQLKQQSGGADRLAAYREYSKKVGEKMGVKGGAKFQSFAAIYNRRAKEEKPDAPEDVRLKRAFELFMDDFKSGGAKKKFDQIGEEMAKKPRKSKKKKETSSETSSDE
jgi:hypothetical protein